MYPDRKFPYWSEEKKDRHGEKSSGACRRLLIFLLFGIFMSAVVIWLLAPFCYPDAMQRLAVQTPVCPYLDAGGTPFFYQRTYDFQWRIDVPLSKISPAVIRVILACEDMQFHHHSGVDYLAVCRSAGLNLRSGKIVSGASTITMQLAGLGLKHNRRRSFRAKFVQAAQARYLEKHYTKDRILTEYLNRIPFGGKIYGIEAAARYYFGKHASELNLLEASLVCGLPQKPNRYRPDRHLERTLKRQKTVLKMMFRHGLINQRQAAEMAAKGRFCFRDFREKFDFNHRLRDYDRHYLQCAGRELSGDSRNVQTFFHAEWQVLLKKTLERQLQRLPGVEDCAGVLIENSGRHVLAMIGTSDFQGQPAGQVNAALARRSPGSLLKPFVYAEAIEAGLLSMDTILPDRPVRYGGYSPENYDGKYYGRIRAGDALAMSLNTPVVSLLAELTPQRMLRRLAQVGLSDSNEAAEGTWERHGLALALGTAGCHLLELTQAMATFPSLGKFVPAVFTADGERSRSGESQIFAAGTAVMISAMLRLVPLPGCEFQVAWKTGTSNGNHDAWCIAYTPEYTLGIWFGNKTGRADAMLVGRDAAVPAAAAMISGIYSRRRFPVWPEERKYFQYVPLCPISGLPVSVHCPGEARIGAKVRSVPLRPCRKCHPGGKKYTPVRILSPQPTIYHLNRRKSIALNFIAEPSSAVCWYVNGLYYGKLQAGRKLELAAGRYHVTVLSAEENIGSASLDFEVQE